MDELPSKKVQWGENTEHVFDKNESIIHYLEKDILELKTKLDQIIALLQKQNWTLFLQFMQNINYYNYLL